MPGEQVFAVTADGPRAAPVTAATRATRAAQGHPGGPPERPTRAARGPPGRPTRGGHPTPYMIRPGRRFWD